MELNINIMEQVKLLYEQGLEVSKIKESLHNQEISEEQIEQQIKAIKSLKYEYQRKLGFKFLAIGALLCLGGCLFTFLHNDYSAMYAAFTLYGMTITGVLLVLAGLALVLGL